MSLPRHIGEGTTGTRDLSALFDPSSVAIVGASGDPGKWGHAVAVQALRAGDRRPVHLINRRGGEILGRMAATRLSQVGEQVDLVVVAVPAGSFEAAVQDALAQGARAIIGITAGFAETGEDGRARQYAIAERVRAAGAVLVGPNCLGLVDNSTEVYLSSDAFAPGGVAFLSQSGNLALELDLRLTGRGLGISRFISFGNQADVTLVDLLGSCGSHEQTKAIAVYAEDFGDGRAFAAAAAAAGKPVVLLSAGGGEASARSAASHTGSLTSPADVVAAVCRDAGIHQAATPRELAVLLAALSGSRRATGRRTAVLTDGGGHGSIAADVAESAGLAVPELPVAAQDRLRGLLWGPSAVGNPVDLAGMGEQDPLSYATTVAALVDEPAVDAVLLTGFFGGYSAAEQDGDGLGADRLGKGESVAADRIAAIVTAGTVPVVVQSMYPDAPSCRILTAAGIPVFGAIEDAALALSAVTGATAVIGAPRLPSLAAPLTDAGYFAGRSLLAEAGVPFPAAREVRTEQEVRRAAGELEGPFAVKAVGLLHKSDAGGVVLRLVGEDALVAAFREMRARLGEMAYSVEEMASASDGVELIVGVDRDPRFGPVTMVGLGGVHTEVLRDVVFALAPVTPGRARDLLEGLRSAALLHGVRGRPAVDLAAAADVIARISAVAAAHPEIAELEVNPLLVRSDGALALDARVILAAPRLENPWTSVTPRSSSTSSAVLPSTPGC